MYKGRKLKIVKFKTISKKRKQLCTFCGKKFKRVQQHQQFCKAGIERNLTDSRNQYGVRPYKHTPITTTATMSLEDRLQEERLKGYEHGCSVGSANAHNEYRRGLEDMKDFVKYLLEKR